MALTGAPEGPPRFATAAIASAAIGTGRVLEGLAPVLARPRDAWARLLSERAAFFGRRRDGRVAGGGAARLLPARDGWCAVHLPRPEDWRAVPAWLEIEAHAAFEDPSGTANEANWTELARALRDRPLSDAVGRARLLGLAVAPAAPPGTRAPDTPFLWTFETRAPAGRPVHGLRVLDLSTLWAGPLATSLLVDAGADVLKVESPARPDGARLGPAAFHDLLNAGKRSASLDLAQAEARALFGRLLEEADVVVESARPRGLAQLGFDADRWVAGRAGRLWLSITGYGREDPGIAFGDDAAVAAGLAWPHAGHTDDDGPCFTGDALADPLTGLVAAAIVLSAAGDGRGGLVDLPLRRVAAHAARLPLETDGARVVRQSSVGEPEDWRVEEGGTCYAVAQPAARTPRRKAEPLAPPDHADALSWRSSC